MARQDDLSAQAESLAAAIRRIASEARNEEELRLNVEVALRPIVDGFHLAIAPRYEQGVQGDIASGRADAVYGGVYIEYKRPGRLAAPNARVEAVAQVKEYLEAARETGHDRWRKPRLVGVVTDGSLIILVRPRPYREAPVVRVGDAPPSPWTVSEALPIDRDSVGQLLQYLRSLDRELLTAENLARAFGPESEIGPQVVGALYRRLNTAQQPIVQTLYREWDRIFGIVYGQDATRAAAGAQILGSLYKVPGADLKRLFFCVHTYYALLMKILAVEVASLQQGTFIASFVDEVVGLGTCQAP